VDLVKKGMTKGFGYKLNKLLEAGTKNRIIAFFSGIFVTALVQSSNATALIISSFAGQGLIRLSMALAVMLGANVGTTLVAQFVSLDISWLMPVLIFLGVFTMFVYGKNSSRAKNIGRVFLGIGFLFLSLDMITAAPTALKDSPVLLGIFSPLETDPFLAVILSAVITWLLHSSLAFVLLTMAFVGGGIVSVELGLLMVIGANIGGGIAPVILTSKMDVTTFRVAFGNFVMRLLFGAGCLIFIEALPHFLTDNTDIFSGDRAIVNFHTAFSLGLALIFMPIAPFVAVLCKRLIPDIPGNSDPAKPIYLDTKLLDTPSSALATASREALRMSDYVLEMLQRTINTFKSEDTAIITSIKDTDDIVDKLFSQIKKYLVQLSKEEMDEEESSRAAQIFSFSLNMEHIGDIIVKNLLEMAEKKAEKRRHFSEEGFAEIEEMHADVVSNMKIATHVFMSDDVNEAKKLLKQKKEFRLAEMETTKSHMERMQAGRSDSIATSSMHMDIVRDLKRINSHIASTAYPILEREGELKPLSMKVIPDSIKDSSD
tara:strand:- start:1100 stop:2728 length:1629 start_codon:yes stop_codon:yes gene_type:complete